LNKNDLANVFGDKKKETDDDLKSRVSRYSSASRGSNFKAKFMRKNEKKEEVEDYTYESDPEKYRDPVTKEDTQMGGDANRYQQDDAITVASSAIDAVSQAPTELLA
jgi:hypothetical protein